MPTKRTRTAARLPSSSRRRRGSNVIEFALLVPIFITMAGSFVDYGMFLSQQVQISNAVREGARAGSVAEAGHAAAAVTTIDRVLAASGIDGASTTTSLVDDVLTLTITVPYTPVLGLVPTPTSHTETLATRIQYLEES